jgi:WD40 repeat protein
VKVWDAVTGQQALTLKGHTNIVVSVCFSPDGKRLASSSHDGSVKVWDADSGEWRPQAKVATESVMGDFHFLARGDLKTSHEAGEDEAPRH